jgi:hypothetical protein
LEKMKKKLTLNKWGGKRAQRVAGDGGSVEEEDGVGWRERGAEKGKREMGIWMVTFGVFIPPSNFGQIWPLDPAFRLRKILKIPSLPSPT